MLIAAAEEERFVRIKHVAGFPAEAIRYCIREAGIRPEEIDVIAISRNPWSHFWLTSLSAVRRGLFSGQTQERVAAFQKIQHIKLSVAEALGISPGKLRARLEFVEHHHAHLASSFYPSGWESAVILSLDGFGDHVSGMWGLGKGLDLTIEGESLFPHSLGILYTAITQFLGFLSWGDEYKVMGLAAYGKPDRYRESMKTLLKETAGGNYRLGLDYFRHQKTGVSMTWSTGAPILGQLFEN